MFPNDDEENDRLDLFHHIETLSLGGELHLAPIGNDPQRVLGMGSNSLYRTLAEKIQILVPAQEFGLSTWVCLQMMLTRY
jgi:hypothetical protein